MIDVCRVLTGSNIPPTSLTQTNPHHADAQLDRLLRKNNRAFNDRLGGESLRNDGLYSELYGEEGHGYDCLVGEVVSIAAFVVAAAAAA